MIAGPSDWQHRPLLALLAHLAEHHHDAQQARLEHLRELFALATRKARRPDSALLPIGHLIRNLEATSRAHLDTTAVLFAHAVALETGPGTSALPAPTVGRLIQQLRVEHETVRALFETAGRAKLGRASPWGATDAVRDLHAGLSAWEQNARAHARVENEALVGRILALDPGIARDTSPVTLPIRRREVLTVAGRRHVLSVFCPTEKRSHSPEWCRRCPLLRQVMEQSVTCTPPVEAAPVAETGRRLGEHVSVGEAMGGHAVSVGQDVVAGVVAQVLREYGTAVAVVVDDADHLVGTIERDCAECAPECLTADELEREGPRIDESASLADAIERMAKAHARFLPVVGAEGRVVGLLADLEALRRITAWRRRR
jgi:CBS domain-containing protein/iron-sulfur cluster repair protein YtfE (RIC family)